jgi:hypothetical protein
MVSAVRQFPLRECVFDRVECGRSRGEALLSVAELEDRLLDVAFMDGGIIEHESEGRGAVGQGRMCEEVDEEVAEDIARHSFRSGLPFLAAFASRDELFTWLCNMHGML